MENKLDTYFMTAKQNELPVNLETIEKLVMGSSFPFGESILKKVIVRHKILISFIVGSLTLCIIIFFIKPVGITRTNSSDSALTDNSQILMPTLKNSPSIMTENEEKERINPQCKRLFTNEEQVREPFIGHAELLALNQSKQNNISDIPDIVIESSPLFLTGDDTFWGINDSPKTERKILISNLTINNSKLISTVSDNVRVQSVRVCRLKDCRHKEAIIKNDRRHKFNYNDGQWAKVKRGQFYGFIDRNGTEVVTPVYDKIFKFSDNDGQWAKVKRDQFYGFIDRNGTEVVTPVYDKIFEFSDNDGQWAKVKRGRFYGFIDRNGTEVVPADAE